MIGSRAGSSSARVSGVLTHVCGVTTGACVVAEASCVHARTHTHTHTHTVLGGPGQAAKAEASWGHTGSSEGPGCPQAPLWPLSQAIGTY